MVYSFNTNSEKPKLELELDEVNEIIWINKNDLNLNNLAFDSQKDFQESKPI